MGRGVGVDLVPKVLRHFLHKYWEFCAIKKLTHSCPKWADTKVTSQFPKEVRGVDNVQKMDAFFLMSSTRGRMTLLDGKDTRRGIMRMKRHFS